MTAIGEIEAALAPETLSELRAAGIKPGRPVIAVDVDDTLVWFVDHLARWMAGQGFVMRLNSYQLEGSMFKEGSDIPLPFEDCIALINGFFRAETQAQQAIPGAVDAIADLSEMAQIVILTNVPRHSKDGRRANLDALGFAQPLVINSGGKGKALAWLAATAQAPVALVDDSTGQMESARKHVPDSVRLHFAGSEHIARLFPDCAHATEQVHDWSACSVELVRLLQLRRQ